MQGQGKGITESDFDFLIVESGSVILKRIFRPNRVYIGIVGYCG